MKRGDAGCTAEDAERMVTRVLQGVVLLSGSVVSGLRAACRGYDVLQPTEPQGGSTSGPNRSQSRTANNSAGRVLIL